MRPCIEMEYPEFSGCYALVRWGKVVYVGQSRNVLQRLNTWKIKLNRFRAGKGEYSARGHQSNVVIHFERVKLYPCPMAELDQLEEELILLYDPELNIRKPKRKRVDIFALAARAGLDAERWRTASNVYSPTQSNVYRRM